MTIAAEGIMSTNEDIYNATQTIGQAAHTYYEPTRAKNLCKGAEELVQAAISLQKLARSVNAQMGEAEEVKRRALYVLGNVSDAIAAGRETGRHAPHLQNIARDLQRISNRLTDYVGD
jgi:hypothetical protein